MPLVLTEAMNKIGMHIASKQSKDGIWDLGVEPFYQISQTTFALRVLTWHHQTKQKKIDVAQNWLKSMLTNEHLPNYTRTFAWPLFLFQDLEDEGWKEVKNYLGEKLIKMQNSHGLWGFGNTNLNVLDSGPTHPFPTALSLLGLSSCTFFKHQKKLEIIRHGVHWLRDWIDTASIREISSWSIGLLALYKVKTHDISTEYLHQQAERLGYEVSKLDKIVSEVIPNAARNLDAPYNLLSPAWILIALSNLANISTFPVQLHLARHLLSLIQEDGRVGSMPNDPNPYIYCAFNVYYALREFGLINSQDSFINNLIIDKNAIEHITKGPIKVRSKLFIGSSLEGITVARKIQSNFEHDNFDTIIWEQGIFRPSISTMESFDEVTGNFDFAILVLTPDDVEISRKQIHASIRDNVLFELGLFIGALGRKRVFLVHPRTQFKIPTDLAGINTLNYDPIRFTNNPTSALGTACDTIRDEMLKLGPK